MRAALVLILATLSGLAHAQLAPTGHVGLDEFSRICLEPRSLDFTLSVKDQERLGLEKEKNISVISEENAIKFNIPHSERSPIIRWGRMVHGVAKDASTFSIWSLPEKSQAMVQFVDSGRGVFGPEGNATTAGFCAVMTVSNAEQAWSAFAKTAEGADLLYEKHNSFLLGRMRTWLIELPWAPNRVGVVTIANNEPTGR